MKTTVMSLRRLLPGAQFLGCDDIPVSRATSNSRDTRAGDVFFAISGIRSDGHDFLKQAVAAGASAVVVERSIPELSVPHCVVPCSSTAFAKTCTALSIGAAPQATSAGITGTNGKTTTAYMLRSILQAAGIQTGMLGTIENSDGVETFPATMTTPTADVIARHLGKMRERRTSHCVVEISSHALEQKRCAGLNLSTAAITNITQDHFDYHLTAEAYAAAKAKIATLLYPDAPLLLNLDDAGCRSILEQVSANNTVISYAVDRTDAELTASIVRTTHRSQRVRLRLAQGSAEFRLRLIGRHNVANCLAAAGLAEQMGITLKHIVNGLEAVDSVPGRLERVNVGQPFQVLVDYAHTADALTRCLDTIRDFVPGRLICVFGAGGDRDRAKRPLMGAAAGSADLAIVTADNPRSEDPNDIIRDITEGLSPRKDYICEPSRRDAIARAFAAAEPGDAVLIAGKGHENTQEVNGLRTAFDDREVARQILLESDTAADCGALHPVFSLSRTAQM